MTRQRSAPPGAIYPVTYRLVRLLPGCVYSITVEMILSWREEGAASSGSVLWGAGLLATYAAGTAAPLFAMALLWDRLDFGDRRWLRGREISLGRFRLHTTNLLSGLMFVSVGLLFIVFEGLYASGGATDLAFSVERWVETFSENVPICVALAVFGLLFGLLVYRLARGRKKKPVGRGG
jgi:sulfite exporter TauE/SafE